MSRSRLRAALAALAIGGAAALAYPGPGALAQDRPPGVVLTSEAVLGEIVERTPVLGQVIATVESEVATRTAGIVSETAFQVGDRVSAGDVLARLDTDLVRIRLRNSDAAIAVARAGVAVAEAAATRAQQAYERQAQLRGSTAFSKGQFDDLEQSAAEARSRRVRAEAELAQAEAARAQAVYDMQNATIRAPFAGVVTARHAQPGAYLAIGQRVATLLDTGSLEIEVDMPVRLLPALSEGLEVPARFDGGPEVTATLRSLLPVEAVSTRTRPVRFTLAPGSGGDLGLASGKSVTLEVPVSAPRRALTVPKDALVQSRGGWTVFTVEDGKAQPREIEIGGAAGSRIEVTRGLLPGDVVVVRGNERLRPGQPVTPRPADAAAETAAAPREQG